MSKPRLGGLICHALFIPPWIFCTILPTVASALILTSEVAAVEHRLPHPAAVALALQVGLAFLAYQLPSAGQACAALSTAVTYGLSTTTGDKRATLGAAIWSFMHTINFGTTFPYVPAFTRWIFRLDMRSYYAACELRGALDSMGRSKTLYMFHPHGIVTVGFSTNGVWSEEFNRRTYPADGTPAGAGEPGWRGTVFLIAKALRVPSVFFKVICEVSGRLESATRENICAYMAQGRNLAIIPGGFEDATLYCRGKHRTAMKARKGIIKYALQHGYALQPVYTFGENRTYSAFPGLLKLRLWINSFQVPAVAFFGDWRCPLFPRLDSECYSYVGAPLQLPAVAQPTAEQVSEWHDAYLAALTKLFDASKAEVGEPDANLEIW